MALSNRRPNLEEATTMRLQEFADLAESGVTELTGRLKYDGRTEHDRGEVVGRFGGLKPIYPEMMRLSAGPKAIAASIRKGSGKAYERIRDVVRDAMAKEGFEPAKRRSPGRATVPAHEALRHCSRCQIAHTKGQHRFHGKGSFHRTHLWGFNPMTVKRAEAIFRNLMKRPVLTKDDRALLREVSQVLRTARKPARNPACSNPRGDVIGVLKELRYQRTIGEHPGYYKHVFKTKSYVLCLANGDVLLTSRVPR